MCFMKRAMDWIFKTGCFLIRCFRGVADLKQAIKKLKEGFKGDRAVLTSGPRFNINPIKTKRGNLRGDTHAQKNTCLEKYALLAF